MPTQTTLSRVESFPFDSRADGYDADGYPVYDRAVGAAMLRSTFAKFFTDGVFPNPGTALQISKGSGLTVTIDPGIFIIRGAMGGYLTDAHSITLDTAAPQGNTAYGIMLRYDENEQYRSCYIRVVKGDAASTPQLPAPDQSTPGVMEYRLGYVTVPSGATDLSGATVVNEKGLDVCPYAAPFEEIDVSEVLSNTRNAANEALTQLLAYFEQYRDMVDAAVDDTLAGQLQSQITQIQEQLESFSVDFESEVDDFSIEYASDNFPTDPKKLRVKDGGIVKDSLSQWLQIELGIADSGSFDYDDYKSMAQESQGDEDKQTSLIDYLNSTIVTGWTDDQIVEFAGLLVDSNQVTFVGYITNDRAKQMSATKMAALASEVSASAKSALQSKVTLMDYPWSGMGMMHDAFGDTWAGGSVGQTKTATLNGESYTFRLIGVGHDLEATVGNSTLTFQATESLNVANYMSLNSGLRQTAGGYNGSALASKISDVYDLLGQDVKPYVKEVTKNSAKFNDSGYLPGSESGIYKVWTIGGGELFGNTDHPCGGEWNIPTIEGGQYEYWVGKTLNRGGAKLFPRHGTSRYYPNPTRLSANYSGIQYFDVITQEGSSSSCHFDAFPSAEFDIVPCFCI